MKKQEELWSFFYFWIALHFYSISETLFLLYVCLLTANEIILFGVDMLINALRQVKNLAQLEKELDRKSKERYNEKNDL